MRIFLIILFFSLKIFAYDIYENRITSFLTLLYQNILGREADKEGLLFWQNALYDQNQTALEVSRYFFTSKEFKNKKISDEEYIKRIYETLLQREPDREGFNYWLNLLKEKNIPRLQLFYRFSFSKEFEKLTLSHEILPFNKKDLKIAFLERLYNLILLRDADGFGLNYWYEVLSEKRKTPQEIAKDFFYSKEFQSRNLNDEEFVEIAYRTLLNREPEDEGFYFWLDKLKNGYLRSKLLDDFLNSKEFLKITDTFLKRDVPIFRDIYPPIFNPPKKIIIENNQSIVLKLKSFDRSRPVRYEIGGDDFRFFKIFNSTLTEKIPLVFRNPKDKNLDNIYDITIKAFDSKNNFVERNISIEVCPKSDDEFACKYGLYQIGEAKYSSYVNDVVKYKDLVIAMDRYDGVFFLKKTKINRMQKVANLNRGKLSYDMDIFKNYLFVLDKDGVSIIDLNSSFENMKKESVINENGENLYIYKDTLFLTESDGNIDIFNIKDPKNPVFINSLNLPNEISSIFIKNEKMFVCVNEDGVFVFDVSNLKDIKEIGRIKNSSVIKDILVKSNYAYLAAFGDGIFIFDISDLENPKEIKHIKLDSKSIKLKERDDYLFVADLYAGIKVIDIQNPKEAKVVGYLSTTKAQNLWIDKNILYVADGKGGVKEIDISNPITKDILSKVILPKGAYKVFLDKDEVFVADFQKRLDFISVKNRKKPVLLKDLYLSNRTFKIDKEGDISLELDSLGDRDYVNDIKTYKNYLFAPRGFRVEIFDKSDFSPLFFIDLNKTAKCVGVDNNILYVGVGKDIVLFDISDIKKPKKIGSYGLSFSVDSLKIYSFYLIAFSEDGNLEVLKIDGKKLKFYKLVSLGKSLFDVEIKKDTVFAAVGRDGIEIYNLNSFKKIGVINSFNGYVRDMKIVGNYLFAAVLYEGGYIFNIKNISKPSFVAKTDLYGILGIEADKDFMYAVDFNYGLNIIDINFIKNKSFLMKK